MGVSNFQINNGNFATNNKIVSILGRKNSLRINRKVDFGFYLEGGESGEILFPIRYHTEEMKIGDEVEVLVYLDGEERLVATTEEAYAYTNEFACLEVKDLTEYGAFLDWGVMKQLFVPYSEMASKMEVGQKYLVYIYVDPLTNRLIASGKVDKFLETTSSTYEVGQEVHIWVWQASELGIKVMIDYSHIGLIFHNQVFKKLTEGDKLKAYIQKIREDGKIDVSLEIPSHHKLDDLSERLLDLLKSDEKVRYLTDKSDPQQIYVLTEMSKKNFKKALGALYKKKLIKLTDQGVEINIEATDKI